MSAFTLGVHNVPAAEVVLIKTLLRLFPHDLATQWRFAEAGPYDAVLADTTFLDAEVPHGLARVVLKIRRAHAASDADSIARPIRADQLQAWLVRQTQLLQALRRPAVSAAEPTPARPEGIPASTTEVRLKLRRWPAAALLQNDPQRIRLATLMSRRALRPQELSRLSGLPSAQCRDFVTRLREAGLIEIERGEATEASRAPTAAGPALQKPSARSLIKGIRRRLGL